MATSRNHVECVEYLISLGANVGKIKSKHHNLLPCHIAALNGNVKLMEKFYAVDKNVILIQDKNEKTALFYAIRRQQLDAVKFLTGNFQLEKKKWQTYFF